MTQLESNRIEAEYQREADEVADILNRHLVGRKFRLLEQTENSVTYDVDGESTTITVVDEFYNTGLKVYNHFPLRNTKRVECEMYEDGFMAYIIDGDGDKFQLFGLTSEFDEAYVQDVIRIDAPYKLSV